MKKIVALLVAMATIVMFSMSAYAGQWKKTGNDWCYYQDDGTLLGNWKQVGTDLGNIVGWDNFRDDGTLMGQWCQIGNDWFYYLQDETFAIGLQNIDGSLYFFDDNGRMKSNETVNGYYFGSDGRYDPNASQETQYTHIIPETGAYYNFLSRTPLEVIYSDLNTVCLVDEGVTSVFNYTSINEFLLPVYMRDENTYLWIVSNNVFGTYEIFDSSLKSLSWWDKNYKPLQ